MQMSLKKLKPILTILDVGHGNAAVYKDQDGTVVIDTGNGPKILRYLNYFFITKVHALLLSHADSDHIGGAITILLQDNIHIQNVFLNPDPSKNTAAFIQLRYALIEADLKRNTKVIPDLTTNTSLQMKDAIIEVIYPTPNYALGGVGGKTLAGTKISSNSLSAAIKVSNGLKSTVLLGGDIDFDCLDYWQKGGINSKSNVLVFPHHGGLPSNCDSSDASIFAFKTTQIVKPKIVVFSMHKNKYNLPREEIVDAILSASKNVQFICTQLPEKYHNDVYSKSRWIRHRAKTGQGFQDGSIEIKLLKNGIRIGFMTEIF
jgi:beta-lactamase superfamily II metal-dependent hydrolase